MIDKAKDVQGIALYAQFHKPRAMFQLLMTPDGYNEAEEAVRSSLYRRVVTVDSPKKQWRSSAVRSAETADVDFESDDDRATLAEHRLNFATQLFDSLVSGKWELHKEPIYLEVSKKDLTDIHAGRTPAKLMYRINQSRDALNFETDLAPSE